eukprot:scpid81571/ scgid16763/ 
MSAYIRRSSVDVSKPAAYSIYLDDTYDVAIDADGLGDPVVPLSLPRDANDDARILMTPGKEAEQIRSLRRPSFLSLQESSEHMYNVDMDSKPGGGEGGCQTHERR